MTVNISLKVKRRVSQGIKLLASLTGWPQLARETLSGFQKALNEANSDLPLLRPRSGKSQKIGILS